MDAKLIVTGHQPQDSGYFVNGVSGEEFALPEAIGLLRSIRKAAAHHLLSLYLRGWSNSNPGSHTS